MKTLLMVLLILTSVTSHADLICRGHVGIKTEDDTIIFEKKMFEQSLEENAYIKYYLFKTGEAYTPAEMNNELYSKIDEKTAFVTIRVKPTGIHTSINKVTAENDDEFSYNMSYDSRRSNLIAFNYRIDCLTQ